MKNQKGITLISLVITIVVLIILAGVAVNMTLGENGIFTKAQEAKKMQAIASAKEQIGLEILEAQIEAIDNNEELEESKVQEIVAKYGELQSDGDTIILNDTGYEVSLKDIYNTMAETETEGNPTTELAQLKALLAQTTVTEDKVLKDFKAYKNGQLITGTMENYAGQTVSASTIVENGENAEITISQAGYYDTTSKISVPVSEINSNSSYYFYDTFSSTVGDTKKITCGFKPSKIVFYCFMPSSSYSVCASYNKDISETECTIVLTSVTTKTIGNADCQIKSIDNDGFTLYTTGTGVAGQYVRGIAIK